MIGGGGGGGGGSDTMVFTQSSTAVKMLPGADTESHFWHPRVDMPILTALEWTNEKSVT